MYIKDLKKCQEIEAGDKTALRELLHPDRSPVQIRYSLAFATLKPKKSSLPHKLKSSEVYYILQGEGRMHVEEDSQPVYEGNAIYIPSDSVQWIENTGEKNLDFLCIVDPAWKEEDEEVI